MASNFFSIEFDERYIKIIDISTNNNFYQLNYIGKIDVSGDFYSSDLEKTIENQAKLIRNFITNLNINKKNVVISIPSYYTYHQIFEMPLLKEKELISAIKYQADQFIPTPLNETNIDLEIIKEDIKNKKLLILVAAAPKKIIEKIQSTIELSGLIPIAIETQISSTARLFTNIYDKKKILGTNNFLMINFNYYSSSFISFSNQDQLIINKIHNTAIGYNLFFKELLTNTSLDEVKIYDFLKNYQPNNKSTINLEEIFQPLVNEFVNEINRFINDNNYKNIFIINEIVNFPIFINLLSKKTPNLNLQVLSPQFLFQKNSLLETVNHELPLYFSTIGTDLR
ncbi:MAG: hypothetical protein Fur009_3660 [Candidatus Microgenomates bacterium]